jgi:2-hydroxychromene-2-carboxylate isomerase
MQLLRRMKKNGKSWGLAVFASANAIRKYTMEELVELGVSWIWMGLESPRSSYAKLQGADTRDLTRELREHGIRVQGSTIIGLEHHTPDNIRGEIDYAISHSTDFHQFMLYTPVPGTPLYQQMSEQGRMLQNVDLADIHGQDRFNFEHAAISREESKRFLDLAFQRDYEQNGPSLYRMCRTMLQGWSRYKQFPDARVRERFARESVKLRTAYSAALWAMEHRFRQVQRDVSQEIRALRQEVQTEFGNSAWLAAHLGGPLLSWTARREDRRLSAGRTYEPPTFLERSNWVAAESV